MSCAAVHELCTVKLQPGILNSFSIPNCLADNIALTKKRCSKRKCVIICHNNVCVVRSHIIYYKFYTWLLSETF